MVFLTGPGRWGRPGWQRTLPNLFRRTFYLNYDSAEDREILRQEAWLDATKLLNLQSSALFSRYCTIHFPHQNTTRPFPVGETIPIEYKSSTTSEVP